MRKLQLNSLIPVVTEVSGHWNWVGARVSEKAPKTVGLGVGPAVIQTRGKLIAHVSVLAETPLGSCRGRKLATFARNLARPEGKGPDTPRREGSRGSSSSQHHTSHCWSEPFTHCLTVVGKAGLSEFSEVTQSWDLTPRPPSVTPEGQAGHMGPQGNLGPPAGLPLARHTFCGLLSLLCSASSVTCAFTAWTRAGGLCHHCPVTPALLPEAASCMSTTGTLFGTAHSQETLNPSWPPPWRSLPPSLMPPSDTACPGCWVGVFLTPVKPVLTSFPCLLRPLELGSTWKVIKTHVR